MSTNFVCTLPPAPNNLCQDPIYMVPQDFISYDDMGKIIHSGIQARGFLYDRSALGEKILFGLGSEESHYVELIEGRIPVLRSRPVIDWTFDKLEMMVRQEATLAHLPPAIVSFTGPVTGTQEHTKLGDLKIGWTTPGDYLVSIQAFPYKDASFAIKVKALVAVAAQTNTKAAL